MHKSFSLSLPHLISLTLFPFIFVSKISVTKSSSMSFSVVFTKISLPLDFLVSDEKKNICKDLSFNRVRCLAHSLHKLLTFALAMSMLMYIVIRTGLCKHDETEVKNKERERKSKTKQREEKEAIGKKGKQKTGDAQSKFV